MTSLSVAFWSWLNTSLCCPAPAGFPMAPAVLWRPVALHCIANLFPISSSLPDSGFLFLQQVWLQHWTYVLSPFLLSTTSVPVAADRSFFITFQAIWALKLYTAPSHLRERSFLWFVCVSVCVLSCSFGDLLSFTLTAFVELMDHGIVSWDTFSVAFIKKVSQENDALNRARI